MSTTEDDDELDDIESVADKSGKNSMYNTPLS